VYAQDISTKIAGIVFARLAIRNLTGLLITWSDLATGARAARTSLRFPRKRPGGGEKI
jgi:hypothetical protein